ncbi:aminotransferase class I/II-fold pyridoxal phosphate-dependent enzyme, partial [Escherichia coli]|uniref:aminotransferase class I/II-fold pyridoxal phosphate-dependent enzyme n=1 Tax=Escherichia coli TaxID=562 RepID=UPI00207CBAF1
MSFAQSFSFAHNDLSDLEKKIQRASGTIFIVTESVFSMDGDIGPLTDLVAICKKYHAHLIIDEAHATGVLGERG